MAVTTVARIQHRRGLKEDLPANLAEGELGFCMDTRELFIGNSAANSGNTQVLTNTSNVVQSIPYEFLSSTSVVSQTGLTMNEPVVRTLQQQLDDQWVNIRAYGAQGDGQTDDTDAINRAIQDLSIKNLSTAESVWQARKALWFPSGTYLITSSLLIYPWVRIVGEHQTSTQIQLLTGGAATTLFTTVDSQGQTGASIGNNGSVPPEQIYVSDISFTTTEDHNLIVLTRAQYVSFERCSFIASWSLGDSIPSPAPIAVQIDKLGGVIECKHYQFTECTFQQIPWAFNCEDIVDYITWDRCVFNTLHLGIRSDNQVGETGPSWAVVSNSVFVDIESFGIQWLSSNIGAGPGIASHACRFINVGADMPDNCIIWGASSNSCSSVGDQFDLSIVTVPIADQGNNNMILDAQYNSVTTNVNLILTPSNPYNVTPSDNVVIVDTSVLISPVIQLPATAANGRLIHIKDGRGQATTNNIIVTPDAAQYIESLGMGISYIMNTNYQSISLVYESNSSKWHII
jgi:hypothetical protein